MLWKTAGMGKSFVFALVKTATDGAAEVVVAQTASRLITRPVKEDVKNAREGLVHTSNG